MGRPDQCRGSVRGSVDFVADNRVIFDIGGNKFRLIVDIAYKHHKVLVKFVRTHAEYDKIDPVT
jgi:mRNA interferase HigB